MVITGKEMDHNIQMELILPQYIRRNGCTIIDFSSLPLFIYFVLFISQLLIVLFISKLSILQLLLIAGIARHACVTVRCYSILYHIRLLHFN
jgi:hypothetical protein